MLRFSEANAKTANLAAVPALSGYLYGNRKVYSLDLTSGLSCPGAQDCKSYAKVDPQTGKATICDGPACQFRCFSASQEVQYPALRAMRAENFRQIREAKGVTACFTLLSVSLPVDAGIVRYHVGGDWFKLDYLLAAIRLAESEPERLFYSYTKSLHHLEGVRDAQDWGRGVIRHNFLVTASRGGKYDNLIDGIGVRTATVVYSEADALKGGLPIDHDDSHASTSGGNFALLIHGTQPKGSAAAVALKALKGVGSYSRKQMGFALNPCGVTTYVAEGAPRPT